MGHAIADRKDDDNRDDHPERGPVRGPSPPDCQFRLTSSRSLRGRRQPGICIPSGARIRQHEVVTRRQVGAVDGADARPAGSCDGPQGVIVVGRGGARTCAALKRGAVCPVRARTSRSPSSARLGAARYPMAWYAMPMSTIRATLLVGLPGRGRSRPAHNATPITDSGKRSVYGPVDYMGRMLAG